MLFCNQKNLTILAGLQNVIQRLNCFNYITGIAIKLSFHRIISLPGNVNLPGNTSLLGNVSLLGRLTCLGR
jgi:hypothetical protein